MSGSRNHILTLFAFILQVFILVGFIEAVTSDPKHEYMKKPGYNEGHAYNGILPEETIDLSTGGQRNQR